MIASARRYATRGTCRYPIFVVRDTAHATCTSARRICGLPFRVFATVPLVRAFPIGRAQLAMRSGAWNTPDPNPTRQSVSSR
jgi:hypothetical protein